MKVPGIPGKSRDKKSKLKKKIKILFFFKLKFYLKKISLKVPGIPGIKKSKFYFFKKKIPLKVPGIPGMLLNNLINPFCNSIIMKF